MSFINDSTGMLFCKNQEGESVILKVENYGANLTEIKKINIGTSFNSIKAVGSLTVLLSDNQGSVYKTYDFGETWFTENFAPNVVNDIDYSQNEILFIVGTGGLFQKSTNKGISWDDVSHSFNNSIINYIKAIDEQSLYVHVASSGMFSNTTATPIPQEPGDFKVWVTPNPSSDFIQIETNDPSNTITNVVIFDFNGLLVLSSSSSKIDVSHLASGRYFLKVKFENT